jgi:hypothetical protein
MKIVVEIDTCAAEDGYEEDEIPSYAQHIEDIGELLRSGYYSISTHYVR